MTNFSTKRTKFLIRATIVSILLISFINVPLYLKFYFQDNKPEFHCSINSDKSQLLLNNVIGTDNRIRITPTTSYPWSTIVKLFITWGAYNTYGTGVLIDENHVLTAGHCVYSHSRGGWADNIKVVPGADNGNEPYGHAWAIDVRSFSKWINDEDGEHDFALITLDRDIGSQTGWMELYTSIPSNPIYSGTLNTAGYPYDLDNGNNMYWTSENGGYTNEYNHFFYLDIEGGQSGSPVWTYDGTNRYVISIVTTGWIGLNINYGTRINRNKLDCINNWIAADDTFTDKPDLRSESNSFAGFNPILGGSGLTNLDIWCKVINIGTNTPSTFTVSYYASLDTTFSTDDYLIGTDTIAFLTPTDSTDSQWSGLIPNNIPSGEYYIGWILDVYNDIDEFNENNNWNFIWDYKLMIDASPPINPIGCDQTNGVTESNVWQSEVNDPAFNWTSFLNSQQDIDGFYYYWGTEPNGKSSFYTKVPEYDPPSVNSGTFYMRVCARDSIGNNASWTTLYVFKYDGIAPINPLSCEQRAGSTESDVWQGDEDDPFFIWDDGYDNLTGVAGYYYYWGPMPFGTSNSYTTSTIFNPPKVTTGIYYLRVSTKDIVGNTAPWTTLYVFKYKVNSINSDGLSKKDSDVLIYFILYGLPTIAGTLGVIFIFQIKARLKK
jgi:V8-like Glu-specific endopeptidase